MDPKKIIVNGVEYKNLNDVPEALRALFADADGNGVPDLLEGKIGNINWMDFANRAKQQAAAMGGPQVISTQTFVVEGRTYASLDAIPEPKRSEVIEKMKKLGQSYEGWTSSGPNPLDAFGAASRKNFGKQDLGRFGAAAYPDYETRGSGTGKFILAVFVVFVVLAIAAGVFFLFVMPQK